MDISGTIKVSHIRVHAAFQTALADFDLALPELLMIAGVADARTMQRYEEASAKWQAEQKENSERYNAWKEYDKAKAAYEDSVRNRGFFQTLGPAPVPPDVPRPRETYYYDRAPGKPQEFETSVYAVNATRRELKKKLDIASLACAPYRVDYDYAAFIASCEDGSYVKKLLEMGPFLITHVDDGITLSGSARHRIKNY
jgi:hypothetical protein